MSTYLDLPFTASLVALLTLSRLSIWLDLQLWCQTGWDLRFFKNSNLSESSSFFFPEGLSETFIGCTNLLTLYPYFRQENIYLMQCMMQRMIMNDMFEYLLVFHLNLFCSSVLGFFVFLCLRILYRHVRLVYHASLLSLKSIFTFWCLLVMSQLPLCSKFEHCDSSI